jgi:membrane protein
VPARVPEFLKTLVPRVGVFSLRVIKRFNGNNGILLASAVGYNVAISLVPLFALVLILLSHFLPEDVLLEIVVAQVRLIVPGELEATRDTMSSFLERRETAGWIGLGAMIVFSSLAFRMLESSVRTIFKHHDRKEERKFFVSALMPFAFTGAIGAGLVLMTFLTAAVGAATDDRLQFAGREISLDWAPNVLMQLGGYAGLVVLFTAFYRLMPVGQISTRRALAGGLVAGTLWELVRIVLLWYFANVSLVGVVYGSLATTVVVLLSMEIAAVILLLGAQVIAELEQSADADLRWYEDPQLAVAGSVAATGQGVREEGAGVGHVVQ